MSGIYVLGELINSEHPHIVSNMKGDNLSFDGVMVYYDFHVVKKFSYSFSLRSAAVFIKAEGDSNVSCQIDTLHRMKNIFAMRLIAKLLLKPLENILLKLL